MEFTSRDGANRQVMYLSPKLHGNSASILRIVYSDLDAFSKYKNGLKNATELLMSGRYQSGKTLASAMVPNGKKPSEMQASPARPAFSQAISNLAVSELIYFGFVDFGSNGAYSRYGVLALLADNSCTKGIDTLFKEGVAVSRKKHPEVWGECRIRNGKLEMRWNDAKSFKAMKGFHEKLKPLAVDERLSGCWRKTSGYGGAVLGTTSIAQDKWCFARSGRFSNEGFVGVTGSATIGGSHTVGSGYGDSSKSGWYQIDGRTIHLVYDSGKKMTKVIGLDEQNDDGSSTLILGNEVFFSQDSG